MIKAIIFDFDGVLVESIEIKTGAFARLFESEGDETVRKVVDYHLRNGGVSRFDKFNYIYKNILNRSLTKKKFKSLCNSFSSLVMREVIAAPYVRGAKEFLDKFSAVYKLFVSSATPQAEIEKIVAKRGMKSFFSGIYGAPKDKKEIARDIIREHALSPREVMYIGDAASDYEAARANGTHFIGRLNNNEEALKDVNALKIRDLTNLKEILDARF